MTLSPARMAGGANTGAPSPNCTLPGLWVAASRMTLSPARMAGGANTGAPSPNCTLPGLWVAASRLTLSPARTPAPRLRVAPYPGYGLQRRARPYRPQRAAGHSRSHTWNVSCLWKSPFLVPSSLKVLGLHTYWIPVLGPPARGIGTGRVEYWDQG